MIGLRVILGAGIAVTAVAAAVTLAPHFINKTMIERGVLPLAVPALTAQLKGGDRKKTVPLGASVTAIWPAWREGPVIAVAISLDGEREFAEKILQPTGDWDYLIDAEGNNLYLERNSSLNFRAQAEGNSLVGTATLRTDENGALFDCVDRDFSVIFEIGPVDPDGKISLKASLANPKECNGYVRKKIEGMIEEYLSKVREVPNTMLCDYNAKIQGIRFAGDVKNDDIKGVVYIAHGKSPLCNKPS